MLNSFIADAWAELEETQVLYMAAYEGIAPYILNPIYVDREPYLESTQTESLIMTFLSKSDAQDYCDMILEVFEPDFEKLGIKISVAEKTLEQLFEEITELNEMSEQEFGCPTRLDVCKNITPKEDPGAIIGTDVLYSSYMPLN